MDSSSRRAGKGARGPGALVLALLGGLAKLVFGLSALVAALFLAVVGLIVGAFALLAALVTGRRPQVMWNIRRGGWRRHPGEPGQPGARPFRPGPPGASGEVVDVEVREVPNERLDR
jgi:hypothetical protein